jgi:hypothetical protein
MDIETKEPTLQEMAKAYVDTLYSPANGHGQHVHPRYGRSDNMLYRMHQDFGVTEANKAIDAEFAKRRSKRPLHQF